MKTLIQFHGSREDIEKAEYSIDHRRVLNVPEQPKDAVGIYQPHPYDTLNRFYVFEKK